MKLLRKAVFVSNASNDRSLGQFQFHRGRYSESPKSVFDPRHVETPQSFLALFFVFFRPQLYSRCVVKLLSELYQALPLFR